MMQHIPMQRLCNNGNNALSWTQYVEPREKAILKSSIQTELYFAFKLTLINKVQNKVFERITCNQETKQNVVPTKQLAPL